MIPHVYAIRKRGTEDYLPSGDECKPLRRGFSWTEPQPNGGKFGPRFFTTLKSAQNALTAWCQGRWVQEKHYSGEYNSEISIDTVPTDPETPRNRKDFEVVPFRLVEEVSLRLECNPHLKHP